MLNRAVLLSLFQKVAHIMLSVTTDFLILISNLGFSSRIWMHHAKVVSEIGARLFVITCPCVSLQVMGSNLKL